MAPDSRSPAGLSRIAFSRRASAQPLQTVIELTEEVSSRSATRKGVVVVVGRSRRMAVESHTVELQGLIAKRGSLIGSEVTRTVGEVGAALVAVDTNASLLVLQARA